METAWPTSLIQAPIPRPFSRPLYNFHLNKATSRNLQCIFLIYKHFQTCKINHSTLNVNWVIDKVAGWLASIFMNLDSTAVISSDRQSFARQAFELGTRFFWPCLLNRESRETNRPSSSLNPLALLRYNLGCLVSSILVTDHDKDSFLRVICNRSRLFGAHLLGSLDVLKHLPHSPGIFIPASTPFGRLPRIVQERNVNVFVLANNW